MRRPIESGLSLAFALAFAGCSATDSALFESGRRASEDAPAGGMAGDPSSDDSDAPSEREIESDYEAPVATGHVVWVANPKSGRVAMVDASTLQVRTVEAGNGPTFLASVPGQPVDTTLVLNVLSEDATLIQAGPTGIETSTYKTAKQANSLSFSSDGRFAIAWTDARKAPGAPKTQGFQDLTVMDLVEKTSTILAVGYRPVAVGFTAGKPEAHAVTQDGVALIDLSGAPKVRKNVLISNTPNEDPGTRDVFVSKDGKQAFIRRDGSNTITVVALDTDARTDIVLSGPVTDLDVADTGEHAVAVVREQSEVTVVSVGDLSTVGPVKVEGETIGSVAIAPGGNTALLYTNAAAVERFTILDLQRLSDASPFRTVRLYSPVLGIFPTPDAGHAIVLHDTVAGDSPGAFSLVPVGVTLPAKIVATEAPLTAVATTNDRAIVAERNDQRGIFGAFLARMPQLMVERYTLASPPIAVGVVPAAKRAFVAQQHPEGRLTFIDLETGVARTLTGFELSSRVVDGSKP